MIQDKFAAPRGLPERTVAAMTIGALFAALFVLHVAQAGAMPRRVPAGHGASPAAASLPMSAQAHEAFRAGRYAEAYGRYAALADAGDASAAWMALMLVSNGPTLFGRDWSATPGQLARWSALASRQAEQRSASIPVHDRGE